MLPQQRRLFLTNNNDILLCRHNHLADKLLVSNIKKNIIIISIKVIRRDLLNQASIRHRSSTNSD